MRTEECDHKNNDRGQEFSDRSTSLPRLIPWWWKFFVCRSEAGSGRFSTFLKVRFSFHIHKSVYQQPTVWRWAQHRSPCLSKNHLGRRSEICAGTLDSTSSFASLRKNKEKTVSLWSICRHAYLITTSLRRNLKSEMVRMTTGEKAKLPKRRATETYRRETSKHTW